MAFRCPVCGMVSHNPNDEREGYCGKCHDWTGHAVVQGEVIMADEPMTKATAALNKLCKWRSVLAGWHMGTRSMNEPGTKAMRDFIEKLLVLRAEQTALIDLLLAKKVFTRQEIEDSIVQEARLLDEAYARAFPGFRTTAHGVDIDLDLAQATMKDLGFPP